MVKKLRRQFIVTAMSALLVILVVTIGIINVTNIVEITSGADDILSVLAENDGAFPSMNFNGDSAAPEGTAPSAPETESSVPSDAPSDPASADAGSSQNSDIASDSSGNDDNTPPAPKSQEKKHFNEDIFSYNRNAEVPFSTRYFWVRLDANGEAEEINTGHIAAVSSTQATELAQTIYSSGKTKGYSSTYRYYVKTMETGGTLILFKDCSSDLYSAIRLMRNSFLLMLGCLAAMFVLVWLMSGHAVSPVVESLEKQKRFITDAGHELKTPLAVISANVDVLELDGGKSEWTQSIRNQVNRMTGLVKNMLTLSRMEEENIRIVFSDIDLSSVLKDTANSFTAVAESRNKHYSIDIAEGVHINGDKNSMTQLASLLIDNAMKYSSENGNVSVRMHQDKQVIFEVNNTCDNIPEGNLDRLFDRFYRADASRNRKSGGYGIGLSVARAIVTTYGGSIEALRDGDHMIRFIVKIPKGGVKVKSAGKAAKNK